MIKHGVVRPMLTWGTSKTSRLLMEFFKFIGKEADIEQNCRMGVGRMYNIVNFLVIVSLPNYIFSLIYSVLEELTM